QVHDSGYMSDVAHGTLSAAAVRRLGFPWSQNLVRRTRLSVDGTRKTAELALQDGIAANLAGGTHHSFVDRGEGYCVFNDIAIAIRGLQRDGGIARALIVDLDVHQGNGTAAIFRDDESVFTFSMHGARNYPFRKEVSDCDVALPDGTTDDEYLAALATHLPACMTHAQADIVFYLAGVDVVEHDRFGRLALTRAGLHERERFVLQTLRNAGLPTAVVLGGGYAATAEATADLHAVLHREARGLGL
ncbi:MAG: histone deacetylase, partial [Phycisphaerae bacterium]